MKPSSGKTITKTKKCRSGSLLSSRHELPFVLCFWYKLENGYTFSDLSPSNVKVFQRFLDKVSKMTFVQADKQYLRETDRQDRFEGMQVVHYAVTDRFRVHGVIADNRFMVLRLDPKHKFHG